LGKGIPFSFEQEPSGAATKNEKDSKCDEGGEDNEISEVVLRKRSDVPQPNIPNLPSPTSTSSSIPMTLNGSTTVDEEKNNKVIMKYKCILSCQYYSS
jgi:hypothetical protein